MLERLNEFLLTVADPLLGWLLALPRDVVLLAVALGTAVILTLVRKFTTDQEMLARCKRDKKRLGDRMREVKKRNDSGVLDTQVALLAANLSREGHRLDGVDTEKIRKLLRKAVRRLELAQLTATRNLVSIRALKQEGLPLLVSLPLIALIATWAFARIGFHAPEAHEPTEVHLYLPKSAGGARVHLEPRPGLRAVDGWVREVEVVTRGGQTYGLATWTVEAEASEEPHALRIKHGREVYPHRLLAGQVRYEPPLRMIGGPEDPVVEVAMDPYRPFGVVPGITAINFAPWIVGYLLIVIPFVPLFKRVLRIH